MAKEKNNKKTQEFDYNMLSKFLLDNAKIFHYNDIINISHQQGIYVMYEKGQTDVNNQQRIVRIGMSTDLRKRISNHFNGKKGDSVFVKHIHTSLLNRQEINSLNNIIIEDHVSDYINKNISFNLIYVSTDKNVVVELEKRMIRTVAKYSKGLNVSNWLGKNCNNKKVQDYNIWNSDDVEYEYTLDKNYFDLIECGLVRK